MKVARKYTRRWAWPSIVACGLLAAAVTAPAAMAHSDKKNGLEIVHPWTFATAGAGGTTLVFMKIKNLTGAPERLVGASTTTAAKVELREPAGDGANAASKPTAAVMVGPGSAAELSRNGPHLVLTGLKKQLNAYDSFQMTLVFEKGGRMVVEVMVEEAEAESSHKH
jgi:periplasmic copper chaperone A